MKKEIINLGKKYNIEFNFDRERFDPYDNKSGYITRVWKVINGNIVCIQYTKISNIQEKLNELEVQIKKAL